MSALERIKYGNFHISHQFFEFIFHKISMSNLFSE